MINSTSQSPVPPCSTAKRVRGVLYVIEFVIVWGYICCIPLMGGGHGGTQKAPFWIPIIAMGLGSVIILLSRKIAREGAATFARVASLMIHCVAIHAILGGDVSEFILRNWNKYTLGGLLAAYHGFVILSIVDIMIWRRSRREGGTYSQTSTSQS